MPMCDRTPARLFVETQRSGAREVGEVNLSILLLATVLILAFSNVM
jgi:hypothetical protein